MEQLARRDRAYIIGVDSDQGHSVPAAIHKLDFVGSPAFVDMHDCSNITAIKPFVGRFTIEHDKRMFGNHDSSSGYAVTSRGGRPASTIAHSQCACSAMRLTADSTLHDVFYAVWRPDGSELVACGGKGQKIACQFLLTITGIAERLEPCRLGAAVGMLRIEQIVANFFGCGGRLVCVRNWHRVSNGRTLKLISGGPRTQPHRWMQAAA